MALLPMPFIEVSAGLLFRRGQLLITQRNAADHLGGLWEFPGGKREPDETFEECLKRELQEELGVEIVVGQLIETIEHHYPEKSVRLKFFQCRLLQGEPRPIGCANLAWIEPDDLGKFQFPPADEQLLDSLRRRRELWSA